MIDPKQIPDEVVEAAAKAEYELIRDEYRDDYGVSILTDAHPPWERMHDSAKDYYRKHCRAAIAAALNAWPGAELDPYPQGTGKKAVVKWYLDLPLPQESENAEA